MGNRGNGGRGNWREQAEMGGIRSLGGKEAVAWLQIELQNLWLSETGWVLLCKL